MDITKTIKCPIHKCEMVVSDVSLHAPQHSREATNNRNVWDNGPGLGIVVDTLMIDVYEEKTDVTYTCQMGCTFHTKTENISITPDWGNRERSFIPN